MSLMKLTAMTSAAVATNGTITFNYPSGTGPGTFNGQTSRHVAFSRGLQNLLTWPVDFSLTFGASNITFTYLGLTSIPANTQVDLQLETAGQNDGRQMLDAAFLNGFVGNTAILGETQYPPRIALAPMAMVKFGSPSTISTTAVLATTAVATTTLQTLATPVTFDCPRALQIVSSNAGDTTQVITIRGLDEFGVAMTQNITLNGTTPVFGTKAFKTVISYQASVALAGNLSIGNSKILGLPLYLAGAGWVLRELQDQTVATAGSFVAGVNTIASATTGDVRGTWTPNATLNGTIALDLFLMAPDPTYRGITQF
jgi:hypothetical protein